MVKYSLLSTLIFDVSASSIIPRIPLSGVRISCDIVAKNIDFTSFAFSAFNLAASKSLSFFLKVVISTIVLITPVISPFSFISGFFISLNQYSLPSLLIYFISIKSALLFSMTLFNSSNTPFVIISGRTSTANFPMISSLFINVALSIKKFHSITL